MQGLHRWNATPSPSANTPANKAAPQPAAPITDQLNVVARGLLPEYPSPVRVSLFSAPVSFIVNPSASTRLASSQLPYASCTEAENKAHPKAAHEKLKGVQNMHPVCLSSDKQQGNTDMKMRVRTTPYPGRAAASAPSRWRNLHAIRKGKTTRNPKRTPSSSS
jgi:hypothetical protein